MWNTKLYKQVYSFVYEKATIIQLIRMEVIVESPINVLQLAILQSS